MTKNNINKTRRNFLKNTAIGVGGISAISTGMGFTQAVVDEQQDPDAVEVVKTDVAVVGGGVSGCYAALRLAKLDASASPVTLSQRNANSIVAQPPRPGSPISNYLQQQNKKTLDVKMFEYSGRIGGRLLSTPIQGIPEDPAKSGPLQYAEFGGFRFDRQMKIVWDTAKALKLKDETFFFQDIKIEDNNIVNVRGDLYTNSLTGGTNSSTPPNGRKYESYPNLRPVELALLKGGFDLENYITDQAFGKHLPIAVAGDENEYKNIKSIKVDPGNKNQLIITFKESFNPKQKKPPSVMIPNTMGDKDLKYNYNGFSFAYVRYHYAFNARKWEDVKAISDSYENAKKSVKIGGRPFYDWSWWAFKRYALSQEAVAYLEDTSGYNEEGTFGSIESDIDETFYFSVKSDSDSLIGLTYYQTDPRSVQTAWRHIQQGYSAIPKGLYHEYKNVNSNKSIDVVKHQLISFEKLPLIRGGTAEFPMYKCIFLKRQQGPDLAVSGAVALNEFNNAIARAKTPTSNLTGSELKDAQKMIAAAHKTLSNYKIVYCSFLVLAMPRRSIELINQNNSFFANTDVQRILNQSVNDIPSMRMFVAYPKPWWLGESPYTIKNPQPKQSLYYPVGRTTTDLGIRQLYYWGYNKGKNNQGNFADPNKPAVMLASYTSGQATLYWRSIQDGQPYDLLSGSLTTQGHLYNMAAGSPDSDQNIRNPQAGGPRHGSQIMGIEAHRQIAELHNVDPKKIPLPYYVHYEDWTKDPWGAGWHSWRSGYAKTEYIPLLRKPVAGDNVFIIGECYSNVQGWVQGALNAAEAMLQCNLGLPWASWLSVNGTWLGQGTDWVVATASNPDPNPCKKEDGQFTLD